MWSRVGSSLWVDPAGRQAQNDFVMPCYRNIELGIAFLLLTAISPARSAESSPATAANPGVQITQLADRLRVEINGQLFTEYHYKDVPRPYCYPLMGPGELAMTRNWPMQDSPGEEHDHPLHRSLWFAIGALNGHDFWSEEKGFGKTVHEDFPEIKSGKAEGVIRERNKWVAADGTVVCTDERFSRIPAMRTSSANEPAPIFSITLAR